MKIPGTIILAAWCTLFGCGWDRPPAITLPEPPRWTAERPELTADAYWELEWFDLHGVHRRTIAAQFDRRLLVELPIVPGNGVYPISATLCLPPIDWCTQPAGAVRLSSAAAGDATPLRWDGGLAAHLLLRAARAGVDPAHFNVDRLAAAIAAYAGADPWMTDRARLTTALIQNRMRNALFVPPVRATLGVVAPAGLYYPQSALAAPRATVTRGSETVLIVDALNEERWSWYSPQSATRVTVWRDADGHWFTVVRGSRN